MAMCGAGRQLQHGADPAFVAPCPEVGEILLVLERDEGDEGGPDVVLLCRRHMAIVDSYVQSTPGIVKVAER